MAVITGQSKSLCLEVIFFPQILQFLCLVGSSLRNRYLKNVIRKYVGEKKRILEKLSSKDVSGFGCLLCVKFDILM